MAPTTDATEHDDAAPPDAATGAGAVLRELVAQTCSLVAPRQCPCGVEGAWLCRSCRARLEAPAQRVEACCDALQELTAARVHEEGPDRPAGVEHTALLPVLALGEYEGDLQRLILAWKNGGMLHLGGRIAPALAPAVTALAAGAGVRLPALVPVPSRPGARLRRGEDHTAELVRGLARTGAGRPLLLRATPSATQEGQDSRGRRRRRIRLAARTLRRRPPARPVVIVDDIVTTGSTLRGMHEALTAAGMEVLGAVVVASARMPVAVAVPGAGSAADGAEDRESSAESWHAGATRR